MSELDKIIEDIAIAVESPCILDILGVMSKKKRLREDAALRTKVREELKREMGGLIRSFKSGNGNDPVKELGRIFDAPGPKRYERFCDISDLYARGWICVKVITDLSGNCVPSSSFFLAEITKDGREALKRAEEERQPT